MGFMDKAKKMAEQAQQKLDEAQKGFNEKQGSGGQGGGGPAVEYDSHGRPVNAPGESAPDPQPAAAPPPGDPLGDPAPVAEDTPTSPTPEPAKAEGDPLLDDEPGSRQGSSPPSGPKPGMSSGDPLG